jgi:type IV pilus biogenesis protein CpaD/CtpE
MIADPSDLLGKANPPVADSQRNGILIDNYRQGKPSEPLKGFTASSIGAK